MTISSTIDAAFELTLDAGTGDMSLDGDIGSITRLGAFTISKLTILPSKRSPPNRSL